jgi:beta-galactosidase GanA
MFHAAVIPQQSTQATFLMKQIVAAASAPRCVALQTYVPWNLHEPSPGVYKWDGTADLTGYLDLAAGLGLNVLLRAGPYVCGEWDFGGLPWWLAYPAVRTFLLAPARSSSSAGLKASCLLVYEPALRLHVLPGTCEQQHKC